jgi:hypothetical protein
VRIPGIVQSLFESIRVQSYPGQESAGLVLLRRQSVEGIVEALQSDRSDPTFCSETLQLLRKGSPLSAKVPELNDAQALRIE